MHKSSQLKSPELPHSWSDLEYYFTFLQPEKGMYLNMLIVWECKTILVTGYR